MPIRGTQNEWGRGLAGGAAAGHVSPKCPMPSMEEDLQHGPVGGSQSFPQCIPLWFTIESKGLLNLQCSRAPHPLAFFFLSWLISALLTQAPWLCSHRSQCQLNRCSLAASCQAVLCSLRWVMAWPGMWISDRVRFARCHSPRQFREAGEHWKCFSRLDWPCCLGCANQRFQLTFSWVYFLICYL